jgi:GNAT superfamily N-acetyltransferase
MLEIRKVNTGDYEFIYECLQELTHKMFELNEFQIYCEELLKGKYGRVELWILLEDKLKVGYATLNIFAIPRYLGCVVEFEEMVIKKEFRNKGYAKYLLENLINHYTSDLDCRKVILKTNDIEGSAKLFGRVLNETNMVTFQRFINKI